MRRRKPRTEDSVLSSIHERLINHPELASRIDSILKLASEPDEQGRIRKADEVESILVEELRQFGNESMAGWSKGVDERLGRELKRGSDKVQMREKKL